MNFDILLQSRVQAKGYTTDASKYPDSLFLILFILYMCKNSQHFSLKENTIFSIGYTVFSFDKKKVLTLTDWLLQTSLHIPSKMMAIFK